MHAISQLWLPILATAVFIFIASSLIHMVFKWHNSDYKKLANEDDVRTAIRAGSPQPGQYVLPHCNDMKEMQADAMQKKYLEGPIAFMTVRENGPPGIGLSLSLWFVYCIVIAAVCGAIALHVYGVNANPRRAAHLVGLVSFLAFVGGSVQMGIWMGKPWGSVAKDALDGFIYATIGAFTFMWLWP
jgi:hypothetical protein